jgi:hypothetical protein
MYNNKYRYAYETVKGTLTLNRMILYLSAVLNELNFYLFGWKSRFK